MFRLWAKEFQDNHMLRDTVIADSSDDTRTHKVFHALDEVCYDKARFTQDNFIENIDFDYLEIHVIEED